MENIEVTSVKKARAAKTPVKIDSNAEIICRSITPGTLFMIGKKTGTKYNWSGYGDDCSVLFGDLQAARASRSDFVYDPCFIIEDEEVLSAWPDVQAVYDKMHDTKDMLSILKLSKTNMEKAVKRLTPGARRSLGVLAATAVQSGALDSVSKLRALDEILGTDLLEMALSSASKKTDEE